METDRRVCGARILVDVGHLVVGGAALVFAAVMVVAGRAPNAELDGVLVGLGMLLALVALAFIGTAIVALRHTGEGRRDVLSLALSTVEVRGRRPGEH